MMVGRLKWALNQRQRFSSNVNMEVSYMMMFGEEIIEGYRLSTVEQHTLKKCFVKKEETNETRSPIF